MTSEAQPGQEQRMELKGTAEYHAEVLATYLAQPTIDAEKLASARWHCDKIRAALTHPTADLGEDGELVERVAVWLDKQRVDCAPSTLVGVAISVDDLEGLIRIARAAPYKEALRQIHDHIAPRLGGDQYLVGEAIVKICRPLLASETIND